jgi:hypothetical protein
MEQYIIPLLSTGEFSVVNESNGKMIKSNIDDKFEVFDSFTDHEPTKVYKREDKALEYFLSND